MTNEIVLLKIKEIIAAKTLPYHEKSVSMDTLALALSIHLSDLLLYVNALEAAGSIEVITPKPDSRNTIAISKSVIKLTTVAPTSK